MDTARLSGFAGGFRRLPWETAARVLRTIGFDYVDLFVGSPGGWPPRGNWFIDPMRAAAGPAAEGERVRGVLDTIGLKCPNALVFLDTPVNTRDETAFTNLLDTYDGIARFCTAAAIPTVLFVPGDAIPELGPEGSYALTAERVRRVHAVLARYGVQSALEAHFDSSVGQPDTALRLLEDVPGLGYTIDYSHWIYKGYSPDVVTPLLPRATHFHLRQAAPGRLQARFEEGTIDFEDILHRARLAGYNGVYAIEYLHMKKYGMDALDVMTEVLKMREFAARCLASGAPSGSGTVQ